MIAKKTFNIEFPIKSSNFNHFFKLTTTTNEAIVSNFKFFLTLDDNDLLYKNNQGFNLKEFLFEPLDQRTVESIKNRVTNTTKKYFPNIKIKNINMIKNENSFLVGLNVILNIFGEEFNETISLA